MINTTTKNKKKRVIFSRMSLTHIKVIMINDTLLKKLGNQKPKIL